MSEREPTLRVHVNYGEGKGEWQEWPESDVRNLIRLADEAKERRVTTMPDDAAAIRAMHDAHLRLKELGWHEATYAPKDGSGLQVIEPGSTGIHAAYRDSEGRFWIDGGWPSRPVLFKLAAPTPTESPDRG